MAESQCQQSPETESAQDYVGKRCSIVIRQKLKAAFRRPRNREKFIQIARERLATPRPNLTLRRGESPMLLQWKDEYSVGIEPSIMSTSSSSS